METESQIQLLIKEKEVALQQWNQSKLLIEKLEDEVKVLRELQPNNNKNIISIVQKEYSEVINVLRDKIKTLQDKYKEEICNNARKDDDIKTFSQRTENLGSQLRELEKEHHSCYSLLKQEREKYLNLEKELITVENKLFTLEKKYPCVKILEDERDALFRENNKLSNDCNELETALEICHQKIQTYENDINQYCIIINRLKSEKESMEKNANEIMTKLEKKVEEIDKNREKVYKEVNFKNEKFNNELDLLLKQFHLNRITDSDYLNETSIQRDVNLQDSNLFNIYTLLKNYQNKLCESIKEQNMLETNMEKYKEYIKEANNKILSLEKEYRKKSTADRNELQKYLNKIESTNIELKKQISSQEELHKKWKTEVTELIVKFKNRILNLNTKYIKIQKENQKLQKYVDQFTEENRRNGFVDSG